MAVEFDVKCASRTTKEELANQCQLTLEKYFGINKKPAIEIIGEDSSYFDLEISPTARINVCYFNVQEKMYCSISMNPMRSVQSFLLALAATIALAEANSTLITDEAEMLKLGRKIHPNSLKIKFQSTEFEDVARLLAKKYDVFQS